MCIQALFFGVFAAAALSQPPTFDFEGSTQGWEITEALEGNTALDLFVDDTRSIRGYHSLGIDLAFPGGAAVHTLITRHDTSVYESIDMDVYLPQDAPDDVSCRFFLQDEDWRWYQTRVHSLVPGEWLTVSVSLHPESLDWRGVGHSHPWGVSGSGNLSTIGAKFRSLEHYRGRVNIDNISLSMAMFPEHLRNVSGLSVGEKLELTFHLPTIYQNPFDPEEVSVEGHFVSPSGREMRVPGFFYQEYERRMVIDEQGRRLEALDPLGDPCWKVRFTPLEGGAHTYRLSVRDQSGERSTQREEFHVEAGEVPGFARIDPDGGKGFVLANGEYFYPIGFNYRSPYDTRYEQSILRTRVTDPQEDRADSNVALDDGTFGYEENIAEMVEYGLNMIEVWMSPWWAGLEWTPQRIGFRGIGRYNLRNAWKIDRVMAAAEAKEVYVQLLLINHGMLSTWVDAEWNDHPYNVRNGGFLNSPQEVFSDPRARRLTRNKFRYIVARWGYSPYIFCWNPLNEIDLVGDGRWFWRSREIVEWFREMAAYLKETDPWGHMVTAHFTENYDTAIFHLDDIDFSANNAYYNVGREDIRHRFQRAYDFHQRFNKPFIINEFGGTPHGSSLRNLKRDLQVGLWAGYTMPMAATPLFWWHQLVRDQNWYSMYRSLSEFEKVVGATRRTMDLLPQGELDPMGGLHAAGGQMMHCAQQEAYLGWFYNEQFVRDNLTESLVLEEITGLCLQFPELKGGLYRLVVWDTQIGEALVDKEVTLSPDAAIQLPPFREDIALFLKRLR